MKIKDTEVGKRWKAETPEFFKKVIRISVAVGTVSGAILALPVTLGIVLPATLVTAATYGVAIGTTGATIAKLTKK